MTTPASAAAFADPPAPQVIIAKTAMPLTEAS